MHAYVLWEQCRGKKQMQRLYESSLRGKKQITYFHEADKWLGVELDDLQANFEGFPLPSAKWLWVIAKSSIEEQVRRGNAGKLIKGSKAYGKQQR